ncbi:MAG: OmpA family protein [Pseudomonadota bacterium]
MLRKLALVSLLFAHPALAQTGAGEALFDARFPGAEVIEETVQNFTETTVFTGPFEAKFEAGPRERLEGRVRYTHFEAPFTASTLEVFRAYEQQIAAAGFDTRFACAREDECGGRVPYAYASEERSKFLYGTGPDFRFGLYERTADGAREVVQILVQRAGDSNEERHRPQIVLELVQTEAVAQTLELLSASEIGAAIDADGSAAIYGLEFATDSAELLPASEPVLTEMAAFLNERPDIEILLVGHTDNVGALDYNQGLSERRADAVRAALVDRFGVSGGRLSSHGVGFLAPAASNTTDDGRARNRRVEMILR